MSDFCLKFGVGRLQEVGVGVGSKSEPNCVEKGMLGVGEASKFTKMNPWDVICV